MSQLSNCADGAHDAASEQTIPAPTCLDGLQERLDDFHCGTVGSDTPDRNEPVSIHFMISSMQPGEMMNPTLLATLAQIPRVKVIAYENDPNHPAIGGWKTLANAVVVKGEPVRVFYRITDGLTVESFPARSVTNFPDACDQLEALTDISLGTRIVIATDPSAYDLIDIDDALVFFLQPPPEPPHYPTYSVVLEEGKTTTDVLTAIVAWCTARCGLEGMENSS